VWLGALPTVLVGLFSIWAVHRLTKGREREKSVFEAYKLLGEHLSAAKDAAIGGWGAAKNSAERARAIAETKWRLQQVGAAANRVSILSASYTWRLAFPPRRARKIDLTQEMVALRRGITIDPFEDPTRNADKSKAADVERAVGEFLTRLDLAFSDWLQ